MYYCKVCHSLDEQGIAGHHTRCKPGSGMPEVDNKVLEVANTVANKHGAYADKEHRRAYMRELMRKKRAKAKGAVT